MGICPPKSSLPVWGTEGRSPKQTDEITRITHVNMEPFREIFLRLPATSSFGEGELPLSFWGWGVRLLFIFPEID
jgi:hypothetical protein